MTATATDGPRLGTAPRSARCRAAARFRSIPDPHFPVRVKYIIMIRPPPRVSSSDTPTHPCPFAEPPTPTRGGANESGGEASIHPVPIFQLKRL